MSKPTLLVCAMLIAAASAEAAMCGDRRTNVDLILFHYRWDMPSREAAFLLHSENGDALPVLLHAYGAHDAPHTGHLEGNAKGDWQASWGFRRSDLLPVIDLDGNGRCDPPDQCGVPESELRAERIPLYRTPAAPAADIVLTQLALEEVNTQTSRGAGIYHDPLGWWQMWDATIAVCDTFRINIGHLGSLHEELIHRVEQACGVDLEQVRRKNVVVPDVLRGCQVRLAPDFPIGLPQVTAARLSDNPDYSCLAAVEPRCASHFAGMGWNGSPQAHIEYSVHDQRDDFNWSVYTLSDSNGSNLSRFESTFDDQHDDLIGAGIMRFAEFHDPNSGRPWWIQRAEMSLSNAKRMSFDDYSSLTAGLGAWWEYELDLTTGDFADPDPDDHCSGATGLNPRCNSEVSIYPIQRHTASYQSVAANPYPHQRYYDPGSTHLITATEYVPAIASGRTYYGEVLPSSQVPTGAGDGQLDVVWRLYIEPSGVYHIKPAFQKINVLVDARRGYAVMNWSQLGSASSGIVDPPQVNTAVACGQPAAQTCHKHTPNFANVVFP